MVHTGQPPEHAGPPIKESLLPAMDQDSDQDQHPISGVSEEDLALARRHYRIAVTAARKLDEKQKNAKNFEELFCRDVVALRYALKNACLKLVSTQPVIYGKKVEDLLWRKVFYDVFNIGRRVRKDKDNWKGKERMRAVQHLQEGIGVYYKLQMRLLANFQLQQYEPVLCNRPHIFEAMNNPGKQPILERTADEIAWAKSALVRCLIAMGDLSRYLMQVRPKLSKSSSIMTYYGQALRINPQAGMPYNQLGTLAMDKNFQLDAVFYFMRCICCPESFVGAEVNLKQAIQLSSSKMKTLDKTTPTPTLRIQSCAAKFLSLSSCWFLNKSVGANHGKTCQEILSEIEQCLVPKAPSDVLGVGQVAFSDVCIMRITMITLLCVSRLKSTNPELAMAASTFALSLLSCFIKRFLMPADKLSNLEIEVAVCTKKKPKKAVKHLRRRRRVLDSDEDSSSCETNSDSDGGSSASESSSSSEESSSSESDEDVEANLTEKDRKILANQGVLQSIRLLLGWLRGDPTILKASVVLIPNLNNQLTEFFNALITDLADTANVEAQIKKLMGMELPEDLPMRGVEMFETAHAEINWVIRPELLIYGRDTEAVMRKRHLVNCGIFFAEHSDIGLKFSQEENVFTWETALQDVCAGISPRPDEELGFDVACATTSRTDASCARPKDQELLRDMGRLWLKAEVRDLERAVRNREGAVNFSPYLVLDTNALLQHLHLVKQLMSSKTFVIIVPTVVFGALDELKRDSGRAREAIRWLEEQFRKGNRFLRAQRAGEHQVLPLIKYPKKKEKEAWAFFQILECCAHLTKQASTVAGAQAENTSLVTLLTGDDPIAPANGSRKEFSPSGVAQSAGINFETVTKFCSKWKGKAGHG